MNTNIITLRFTRQIMAAVAMLALVMSLVPMQASAQANPGAIWTTATNCGPSQNVNQYSVGQSVYINGSGFNVGTYNWSIKPAAGGNNATPIAQGSIATNGDGSFCFLAKTLNQSDIGGPYKADVDGKNDNFSVVAGTPSSDPDTGTLTVTKVLNDSNVDKNDFAFTIVDGGDKYRLGNSVSTVDIEVGSSFNVNEVAWDSINLNLYNVQYSGTCSGSMTAEGAACTITNTLIDNDTTLTLVKNVNNTAGGIATANDWRVTAYLGDGTDSQGGVSGVSTASETFTYAQFLELPSKTWTLKEEPVDSENPIIANYTAGNWQCVDKADAVVPVINSQVTLEVGDDVTCTITNTAEGSQTGTLEVKKEVIGNPNFTPDDFEFLIDGFATTSFDITGTNSLTKEVGVYTVTEVPVSGFNTTYDSCVALSVTEGQTSTCTITNTWIPTCSDGIQNQDETGVDIGGVCSNGGGGPALCDDVSAQNYGDEGSCVFYVSQCVSPEVNLLQNGSFEEPLVTNSSNWQIFPFVSGWLIELSDGLELWKGLGIGPSDGLQNAELDGNDATKITQSTTTIPGATYELRFDFAARTANADDNHIEAAVDGVSKVNVSTDNTNWVTYGTTFVADDASTNISFVDLGTPQSNGGTGTLLDNAVLCLVNDPTIITYLVDGYVWEDENENGEWDRVQDIQTLQGEEFASELPLEGWEVSATNGVDEYSTTTDSNGYYYFNLPAGTWTITEEVQSGWSQTFPGNASHVVTVPETLALAEEKSVFATVFSLVIPTVHAQVTAATYGPYNFGNVFIGTPATPTGGGGGGSATRVGRTLLPVVAGEATSRTLPTLPTPLVLGEQVSAVPYGAPATGHGGTSSAPSSNLSLMQILFGARRFELMK